MTRQEWQRAFGDMPEDFRDRLGDTLCDLEERDMKKRYKFTTVLVAAIVAALLIAAAAFAAERLGLFRSLESAEPIHPLKGAEELVATNLGTVKDEYVKLTVEEAVYDGQGVLVQLHVAPVEPERYAVLNDLVQDTPEDVYEHETQLVPVPEDFDEAVYLRSIERTKEDAFVVRNGVRYFNPEDQANYTVRRRDGKTLIHYFPEGLLPGVSEADAEAWGVEADNYLYSWSGEEQADGSVVLWGSGFSERPMGDRLDLSVELDYQVGDGESRRLRLPVALARVEDERRARLVPEGGSALEGFVFQSAEITFTRVRGYLSVEYDYLYRGGDDMGVDFRLYDENGEMITTGGGLGEWDDMSPGEWMRLKSVEEIQSLDEWPGEIAVEVFRIGEGEKGVLGRIRCRVEPE